MTLQKPVCYSAISSIGIHLAFISMAGGLLMSQVHTEPPPKKVIHLKITPKRPPPVPIKKEPMPEKTVKKAAKVVPVQPTPLPRQRVQRQAIQSAGVKRIAPSVAPMRPVAFAASGVPRQALSSQWAKPYSAPAAPRAFRPMASGNAKAVKVARAPGVQSGVAKASISMGAPRVVKPLKGASDGGGASRVAMASRARSGAAKAGISMGAPRVARPFKGASGGGGTSGFAMAPRARSGVAKAGISLGVPRAARPHGKLGGGKFERVAMFQSGATIANLPKAVPRPITRITDHAAVQGYLMRVRGRIDGAKIYPPMARARNQEGKVMVRFTITKNGQVKNLLLKTKTPYPQLNKEALDMVKRAAPFSSLPNSVGDPLEVVLPFNFQLN